MPLTPAKLPDDMAFGWMSNEGLEFHQSGKLRDYFCVYGITRMAAQVRRQSAATLRRQLLGAK